VTWDEPNDNYYTITGCDVNIQSVTGVRNMNTYSAGNGSEYTVTGLSSGTYEFRVRCSNSVGTSDWSPFAEATVYTLPPDTMLAPTLVSTTTTSITMQWIAPDDNGSPITSYQLKFRNTTQDGFDFGTPTPELSATVPGLSENTKYNFRIRAVNAVGASKYSGIFSTKTSK